MTWGSNECHEWTGGSFHTWESGSFNRARSIGFDPCKCGKRVRRLEVREVVVSRWRDEVRGLRPWTGAEMYLEAVGFRPCDGGC